MSSSSWACSLRRTRFMVFTPLSFAREMSCLPRVDPAALCMRYSPSGTFSVSKNPYAVTAFWQNNNVHWLFIAHLMVWSSNTLQDRTASAKIDMAGLTGRHDHELNTGSVNLAEMYLLRWRLGSPGLTRNWAADSSGTLSGTEICTWAINRIWILRDQEIILFATHPQWCYASA